MQSLNQDLQSFFSQIKSRSQLIYAQNHSHILHFLSTNIPLRNIALQKNDLILTHIESIFKKYYNNLESTKKPQSLSKEEIETLNFVFESEQKNLSDSIRNIEFFVDNINNFNDFDINIELEKESNVFNFNELIKLIS